MIHGDFERGFIAGACASEIERPLTSCVPLRDGKIPSPDSQGTRPGRHPGGDGSSEAGTSLADASGETDTPTDADASGAEEGSTACLRCALVLAKLALRMEVHTGDVEHSMQCIMAAKRSEYKLHDLQAGG